MGPPYLYLVIKKCSKQFNHLKPVLALKYLAIMLIFMPNPHLVWGAK